MTASGIRALERNDVPAVARLYELVMRDGADAPPPFLGPFFERVLLDQPWADPEIPSLVYVEDGEVVGFIGSNVRRMRFDGEPIVMACSSHQIAHPSVRNRAVGALLMGKFMAGPQDLTITDGATEPVRRMWERLGGQTVHVSCFAFVEVFRPMQLALGRGIERFRLEPVEPVARFAASVVDQAAAAIAPMRFRPRPAEATPRPLTPAALVDLVPEAVRQLRLRLAPDYDVVYLEWLFRELDRRQPTLWPGGVRRGELWAEAVTRDDRVVGWYVCQLQRGGMCRVLQVVGASDADLDAVLQQLAYRARSRGAAGLYGRVEPKLVGPLSKRPTLIRYSDGRMLVASPNAEIVDAIARGQALLTRLDGEWW